MNGEAQLELLFIPGDVVNVGLFAVIFIYDYHCKSAGSDENRDADIAETVAALPRANEALLLVSNSLPRHL